MVCMFEAAAVQTINGVDSKADQEPEGQPDPCHDVHGKHDGSAGQDTEDGDEEWPPRCLEATHCIRLTEAQDHYTETDNDEGEQCPDGGHLAKDVDGQAGCQNARHHGCDDM